MADPVLPGSVIGPYRVLRLLAAGGMGRVFLARDVRLGRVVALKFAHALLGSDQRVREQFLLEAQTTASLSHPNVVTVFDVGEHEGVPWAAFEYIEGQTLAWQLRQGPLSISEAVRIVRGVAEAVAAAHERGILHRDLKPSNIVLARDGRPRVLDFGIARFIGDEDASHPAERRADEDPFLGTPGYMAPEQWRRQDVAETDVWALGLLLCECLTNVQPLRQKNGVAISAVLDGSIVERVPELKSVPEALSSLVARCLEAEPSKRPSAKQVVDALAAFEGAPLTPVAESVEPYRGARAFDERSAAVFVGRERECSTLDQLLSERPIALVLGPAGCGKTSLIEAGLLPRLRARGRVLLISLRPGRDPWAALARALSDTGANHSTISHTDEAPTVVHGRASLPPSKRASNEATPGAVASNELEEHPERLSVALDRLAERAEAERVVLWVDSLEDLLDPAVSARTRARFLEAVLGAAVGVAERARVVLAVRDDALGRLSIGGALRTAALFSLGFLQGESLESAITKPLERVAFRLEDDALARELARDSAASEQPLLALQCALSELWSRRDVRRRVLLRSALTAVGGLDGAFARHADAVFDALSEADRAMAQRALVLLCLGATGGALASIERALPGSSSVIDALVEGRVLEKRASSGTVALALSSLRERWPRLAGWIEDADEDAASVRELIETAERWSARGEQPGELWRGAAQTDAEALLARKRDALPPLAVRFVRQGTESERRAQRRRSLVRGWVVASLALVAAASTVAAWALSARATDERAARSRADRDRGDLLVRSAALRHASGDPFTARAMVRAALELGDHVGARALLVTLRAEPLRWSAASQPHAYAVAYSSDGATVYAALQSGELWSLDDQTGEHRVRYRGGDQALTVTVQGDSVFFGTWSGDVLRLRGDGAAERVRHYPSGVRHLRALRGGRVAASLLDRRVVVFDPSGARADVSLAIDEATVGGFAASPDGTRVVAGGRAGVVHVIDVERGVIERRVTLSDAITSAAFSLDGARLYVGMQTGRVAHIEGDRVVAEHATSTSEVRGLAELDDRRLLSAGFGGGDVTVLDRVTNERRVLAQGLDVNGVGVFGERVVLALPTGVRSLRCDRAPLPSATVAGHASSVAWSRDGAEVFASSSFVQVRRATDGALARRYSFGLDRDLREVSASGDGRVAFLARGRGAVVVDAQTGAMRATVSETVSVLRAMDVDWSRDLLVFGTDTGRLVAGRPSDGTTRASAHGRRVNVHAVRIASGQDAVDVAYSDGVIQRWSFSDNTFTARYETGRGAQGLARDPLGRFLAVSTVDGSVDLLDAQTLSLRGRLTGGRGRFYRGGWAPNGDAFVAPSSDGALYLWAVSPTATPGIAADAGASVSAADAGVIAADASVSATDAGVPAFELGAPRRIEAHASEANAAAFDPSGARIASVGDDGTVRLFDARTGASLWRAPAGPREGSRALRVRDGFVLRERMTSDGGVSGRLRAGPNASAAAAIAQGYAVGYSAGGIELRALDGAVLRRLEGGPERAVTWLDGGPYDTVIGGFVDGRACVWHAPTGVLVGCRGLNGAVTSSEREERAVTAVSTLGDRARFELDTLGRPWCDLLRAVWREHHWTWREGELRREQPSLEHPCR